MHNVQKTSKISQQTNQKSNVKSKELAEELEQGLQKNKVLEKELKALCQKCWLGVGMGYSFLCFLMSLLCWSTSHLVELSDSPTNQAEITHIFDKTPKSS